MKKITLKFCEIPKLRNPLNTILQQAYVLVFHDKTYEKTNEFL